MSDESLGCLTKPFLSRNFYWKMSDLSKTLILHPVCKFSSISLINLSSIAIPNDGAGGSKNLDVSREGVRKEGWQILIILTRELGQEEEFALGQKEEAVFRKALYH